jgi:hypothetical protein
VVIGSLASRYSGQPSCRRRALRPSAVGLQQPHGLVGIGAERTAAVRHDLAAGRKLGQPRLELLDRDRPRAVDVPGLELLGGAHVDDHDIAGAQPGDRLFTADCIDLVAEVLAGGASATDTA